MLSFAPYYREHSNITVNHNSTKAGNQMRNVKSKKNEYQRQNVV